jgi:hypothetical protein
LVLRDVATLAFYNSLMPKIYGGILHSPVLSMCLSNTRSDRDDDVTLSGNIALSIHDLLGGLLDGLLNLQSYGKC